MITKLNVTPLMVLDQDEALDFYVGKLVIVDRKARLGRNPATGAEIKIPAKRVLKFRIAKQAKDATMAKPKGK